MDVKAQLGVFEVFEVHRVPVDGVAIHSLYCVGNGGVGNTLAAFIFQLDESVVTVVERVGHGDGVEQVLLLERVARFYSRGKLTVCGECIVHAYIKLVGESSSSAVAKI